MTNIEKVARAIYEADDPWHKAWPWPDLQSDQAGVDQYRRIAQAAIAAMQPAPQEPVAWEHYHPNRCLMFSRRPLTKSERAAGWTETPLYAGPTPPQWQGIESSPPPPNTRVLLAWQDWRDGKWLIEAAPYETGRRAGPYSNVSRHGSATHWMPLPTPPKGGSDAE